MVEHGKGVAAVILPGYHLYIVSYKGRDAALEHGRVSLDNILVVNFCGVQLLNNWEEEKGYLLVKINSIFRIQIMVRP